MRASGQQASVCEIDPWRVHDLQSQRKLDEWLELLEKPVAIFAGHDERAREVVDSCWRLRLRIPEDVALLTVSHDPCVCDLVYPCVSSIEMPWEDLGRRAGHLMETLLAGAPAPEPVLVEPLAVRTRASTEILQTKEPRLQKALRWMQEQSTPEWTIEDVAKAVGMDRRALERLFKRELRRSPLTVWTEIRLERARGHLEAGRLRITEIAEVCGFSSTDRMAVAFRKRFGCTPRDYRRQRRPG